MPKRITTLTAVAAIAACLACSSPALAARHHKPHHHPSTDPVTLALKLAERYWGTVPCSGQIVVSTSAEEPNYSEVQSGASAAGLANGSEVLSAWARFTVGSGLPYTDCVVTFNEGLWNTWKIDDENFQWFCDDMTHELGHLLGHTDAGQTNPASVEYSESGPHSPNFGSVPECQKVRTWYGDHRVIEETYTEEEYGAVAKEA